MNILSFRSVVLQVAVVSLVIVGLLSFGAPARASGLTEAQIQAIINLVASFGADQATLSNVTAALRGQATQGTSSCMNITSDLQVGASAALSAQVSKLQSYLGVSQTGTFGSATALAVKQFQAKYGISQTGNVGPITRAKLNQLYGCN